MSLFDELKRRKVFKVGAAYLVVAWLVVQMASIGFPTFDAPPWALRIFILVVFLGFPIALVFAWAFDFTADGLKSDGGTKGDKRFLLIAAGLAVLAFAWYFKGQPSYRDDSDGAPKAARMSAAAAAAAPVSTKKSIAVLPFVNMSSDAGNQFFADGISEELLNVLVRVPQLGVASRTSSFAYKGKQGMGAAQIARELKVTHILEGSVRKAGDRVRITAQLIDGRDDRHIWSETYDRKLDDIFAIQDEIANAIVVALRGSLVTAAAAPAVKVRADTENMQAYELYLRARENFIARHELSDTVGMFERVVQLDPKFARGWEGLAAASVVAPSWGFDDRDYTAMASRAAERALQLDAGLSMPWAVKAQVGQNTVPIDFAVQMANFEKSLAADPRNATALLWRGIVWIRLGFFDRAIADLDRALVLEPHYQNVTRHKALAVLFAGKEAEALALFEQGVAEGFAGSRSENFIAPLFARNRMAALLLMEVESVPQELREAVVARLDNPAAPVGDVAALLARHAADPKLAMYKSFEQSHLHMWLGDFDGAGKVDETITTTISVWDRYPPAWRNSPGMKLKIRRSGVLAYWRAKGLPPQCRTVGADDFTCD